MGDPRNLATKRLMQRALEAERPSSKTDGLDITGLQDAVRAGSSLQKQLLVLGEGASSTEVNDALEQGGAFTCFLPLGLQTVQLWSCGGQAGEGLSIVRPDGLTVRMTSSKVIDSFLSTEIIDGIFSTSVRSHEPTWTELERCMRAYYAYFEKTYEGEDTYLHKRWQSIHCTRIVTRDSTYVLLAAEAASASSSSSSSSLPGVVQPSNSRALVAQQVLEGIAWSVLSREHRRRVDREEKLGRQRELICAVQVESARSILQMSRELRECTSTAAVMQVVAERALLPAGLGVVKAWCIHSPSHVVCTGHKSTVSSSAALRAFALSPSLVGPREVVGTLSFADLVAHGLCAPDEPRGLAYSSSFTLIQMRGQDGVLLAVAVPSASLDDKENNPSEAPLTAILEHCRTLWDHTQEALHRLSSQWRERLAGRLRSFVADLYLSLRAGAGAGGGEFAALCHGIRASRAFSFRAVLLVSQACVRGGKAAADLFDPTDSNAQPLNTEPLYASDHVWMQKPARVFASEKTLLLGALDPACHSALVLPIPAESGACFLVLLLDDADSPCAPDLLSTLQAGKILLDVAAVVDIARRLQSARHTEQDSSSKARRLASLGPLLRCWQRRTDLAQSLARWRHAARCLSEQQQRRTDALLMAAALELSDCRADAVANKEPYLSRVEAWAARLFSNDTVVSSLSALLSEQDEPAPPTGRLRSKSSLLGRVDALGSVQVSRSAGSTAFSAQERETFARLCQVAISALRIFNHASSLLEARSLVPLLAETAAVLLGTLASDDALSDLTAALPLVARGVKRVCGADVALLRLHTPRADGRGVIEALVSSEDAHGDLDHAVSVSVSGTELLRAVVATPPVQRVGEMKLRLRQADAGAELWGEVALIGGSLSSEHGSAAELLGYLVVRALALAQRMQTLGRYRDLSEHLQAALAKCAREGEREKELGAALGSRLDRALDLLAFLAAAPDKFGSSAECKSFLEASLPRLLQADAVSVRIQGQEQEQEHQEADSLPPFPSASSATVPASVLRLGSVAAIVLSNARLVAEWLPFADVLQSCLLRLLAGAVDREDLMRRPRVDVVDREQSRLRETIAQLQSTIGTIEASRTDLMTEVRRGAEARRAEAERWSDEAAALTAQHAFQQARLNDQVLALETDAQELQRAHAITNKQRLSLVSLISFFSTDHHGGESTLQWLKKYAETRGANLLTVTLSEAGTLAGGGGIRGVLLSAGEALGTGASVELFSYMAASSDGSSSSGGGVAVLCVPNRCLPSPSAACQYAVYVFFRGAASPSDAFGDGDKELLVCASNLASRVLLRASVKYNSEEFRQLDVQHSRSRLAVSKYQEIAKICEFSWKQAARTRQEAVHLIEAGAKQLLRRAHLPEDPCVTEVFLWILPWAEASSTGAQIRAGDLSAVYSALSGIGLGSEVDLAQSMLVRKRSTKRAGVLWVAIKSAAEEVLACLRVERRLSVEVDLDLLAGGMHEHHVARPPVSIADVVITEEEEETVEVLCRLLYPSIDKIAETQATLATVQNAAEALTSLQSAKEALQVRFDREAAARTEVTAALEAGLSLLQTMSGRGGAGAGAGAGAPLQLEAARRAILGALHCHECLVILPSGADALAPFIGSELAPSAARSAVRLAPHDLEEGTPDGVFFILEPGAALPERVHFESTDLEIAAMRAARPLCAPDDANRGSFWRSWAGRKYHNAQAFSLKKAGGGEDSPLYSIAVPFALRSGAQGVVSVVRVGAAFSDIDTSVIGWIARVLSFCLDAPAAKDGASDWNEAQHRALLLQKEVDKLRGHGRQVAVLEMEEQALVHDLTRTSVAAFPVADFCQLLRGSPDIICAPASSAEMVLAAARQCFGHVVLAAEQPGAASEEEKAPAATSQQQQQQQPPLMEHGDASVVVINSDEAIVAGSGGTTVLYWVQTRRRLASPGSGSSESTQLVLVVTHPAFGTVRLHASLVRPRARCALLLRLLDYQEALLVQAVGVREAVSVRDAAQSLSQALSAACVAFQRIARDKAGRELGQESLQACLVEALDGFASAAQCGVAVRLVPRISDDEAASAGVSWKSACFYQSQSQQGPWVEAPIATRGLRLLIRLSVAVPVPTALGVARSLAAFLAGTIEAVDVSYQKLSAARRSLLGSIARSSEHALTSKTLALRSLQAATLKSRLRLETGARAELALCDKRLSQVAHGSAARDAVIAALRASLAAPVDLGVGPLWQAAAGGLCRALEGLGDLAPPAAATSLCLAYATAGRDLTVLEVCPGSDALVSERPLGADDWLSRRMGSFLDPSHGAASALSVYRYRQAGTGDLEHWLVPLRNAGGGAGVVAVLRLDCPSRADEALSEGIPEQSLPSSGAVYTDVLSSSPWSDAVQSVLLAFTEALGPLVRGALLAAKAESASRALQQALSRQTAQAVLVGLGPSKERLLQASLAVVGQFCGRNLLQMDPTLLPQAALVHLAAPLSEVLGGCMEIEWQQVGDEAWEEEPRSADDVDPAVTLRLRHAICDERGCVVGRVSLDFSRASGFVSLGEHMQSVEALLPGLCPLLCGVAQALERECEAHRRAAETEEGCATLCEELERTVGRAMAVADGEHLGERSAEQYRLLASLISECLAGSAEAFPEEQAAYSLAQRVCDGLPALLLSRSLAPVPLQDAIVSVALVASGGGAPEWVQTSDREWPLAAAQQDLCRSIALNCVARKAPSCLEIGHGRAQGVVRLTSCPLLCPNGGESMGVLQVLEVLGEDGGRDDDDGVGKTHEAEVGALVGATLEAAARVRNEVLDTTVRALCLALTDIRSKQHSLREISAFEAKLAEMSTLWDRLLEEGKASSSLERALWAGLEAAVLLGGTIPQRLGFKAMLDKLPAILAPAGIDVVVDASGHAALTVSSGGVGRLVPLLQGAISAAQSTDTAWEREQQASRDLSRDALAVMSRLLSPTIPRLVDLVHGPFASAALLDEAPAAFYARLLEATRETIQAATGGSSLAMLCVSVLEVEWGSARSAVGVKVFGGEGAGAGAGEGEGERRSVTLTGSGESSLERALFSGGTQHSPAPISAPADLVGAPADMSGASCAIAPIAPLPAPSSAPSDAASNTTTVRLLRVLYRYHDKDEGYSRPLSEKLLFPLLEVFAGLIGSALESLAQAKAQRAALSAAHQERTVQQRALEATKKAVLRACRESAALLGPWENDAAEKHGWHPILLPPHVCLETVASRVLSALGALVRGDGLALVLGPELGTEREDGLEEEAEDERENFRRVLHTGRALTWAGVEPGSFRPLRRPRAASGPSLVGSVFAGGKALLAANASQDPRYERQQDGICDPGTSLLLVPVWGHRGARRVCAVLLLARAAGAAPFSSEDLVAAELVAAMSSGSLFWLDGLTMQWTQSMRGAIEEEAAATPRPVTATAPVIATGGGGPPTRRPSAAQKPKPDFV